MGLEIFHRLANIFHLGDVSQASPSQLPRTASPSSPRPEDQNALAGIVGVQNRHEVFSTPVSQRNAPRDDRGFELVGSATNVAQNMIGAGLSVRYSNRFYALMSRLSSRLLGPQNLLTRTCSARALLPKIPSGAARLTSIVENMATSVVVTLGFSIGRHIGAGANRILRSLDGRRVSDRLSDFTYRVAGPLNPLTVTTWEISQRTVERLARSAYEALPHSLQEALLSPGIIADEIGDWMYDESLTPSFIMLYLTDNTELNDLILSVYQNEVLAPINDMIGKFAYALDLDGIEGED